MEPWLTMLNVHEDLCATGSLFAPIATEAPRAMSQALLLEEPPGPHKRLVVVPYT